MNPQAQFCPNLACSARGQAGAGNIVTPAEALTALHSYRENLAGRLAYVQARWEAQRPLPHFVDALFDYSVTMAQTELDWITKLIEELEQ